MRRLTLSFVAAALGLVCITSTAPAQARDTNWPCAGCITTHH